MKNYLSLTGLLLVFLFSTTVSGQGFLDRVAKKASEKVEQKAEERAEKKMDEKIDESFDNLEESMEGSEKEAGSSSGNRENKDQKRMSALMKKMGVSSEPVSIEDKYHFSSKMSMHYKNMKSNGKVKDEGDVVTYLSSGKKNFAYEFTSGKPSGHKGPSKGIFIMDYTNDATIILTDENGEKTGVVYGIKLFDEAMTNEDDEYVEDYEDDEAFSNLDSKKTGRTKNIAGYKCEEYAFETEDEKGSFWVAKDAEWKTNDTFSAIFRTGLYSHGVFKGMLMESESTDKETGEKSMMQVTELNDKVSVEFVPEDYELTNLGSMDFNKGAEGEAE
ncbi:MAG: DUF4412 domain-containing protein [Bacteroidota bacterium]